ncbi:ATP-binding protein [Mesorhizobium sp.]|uniref:ATP-binding protein n=1 Tax=Mesorhizobium sp. TaxID=1871066 RepID=UPI0025C5D2C4|nr:ATP-binding protein [Mesorhizobium sp.]
MPWRQCVEASINTCPLSRAVRTTNSRLAVADTGPGISDEIAANLFQPFVTSKASGMGIGLSISKRIIEAHGGKIAARRNGTVARPSSCPCR